jgi:hypothetical protein
MIKGFPTIKKDHPQGRRTRTRTRGRRTHTRGTRS